MPDKPFGLIENHVVAMMLIEPDSGAIVGANRAAVAFYGYPQLAGMNISQINIFSPDDIALERQRAALEERSYFIFPHRLANGTIRTVEVYSSPVLQPPTGKTLLLSLIHDASDKQLASTDSTEYKARLTKLVEEKATELTASRTLTFVAILVATVLGFTGIVLTLSLIHKKRQEVAAADALKLRIQLHKELQHRVKNSLTLMASIVNLETARAECKETRVSLEGVARRMETLASLYEHMLIEDSDSDINAASYIRSIVDNLISGYANTLHTINLTNNAEQILLSAKQASSLGLIANELITNALKHAQGSQSIEIVLMQQGDRAILEIKNPGTLSEDFSLEGQHGFGLLMATELARQLEGTLSASSQDGTVYFVLNFPIQTA